MKYVLHFQLPLHCRTQGSVTYMIKRRHNIQVEPIRLTTIVVLE
jgi:hypothetical protein